MTRSSMNKLFTPFKDPEREFRSSKRHFKTLSLDELRSPDLNLFSDQQYSEEEVAETMAETMEQYMSKTRADYGSGVARPKIEDNDNFELKGQFLKELRTNTFSGSDHEDVSEHIEKVLEIVDLLHILDITIDQVMLRVFPMSLTGADSRWLRNEPIGSITTWDGLKTKFLNKYCPPARTAKKMEEINNFQQEPDENLYQAWERFKELLMKCPQHYLTEMQEVILFYNGLGIPTRQILDSRGAIPSKTAADAKVAIQEMAEYSQKWHNGTSRSRSTETSDGLAAIQAQLNNLGREIKKVNEKVYAAQVGCEQCKGPHYTKDCPLKEEGKTLKEAYYTQFGGPFQGGGYRAAASGFYQRNNANPSYQERRQSMEDTLSKFMSESAKRHEENSNLIKEIQASTDAAIKNQGASIKTLEIQIGQMSKFHLNGYCCKEKKGSYGPQFLEAYSEASHIDNSIPRKEKDPRCVKLLFTYLNLGLGELAHTKLTVELADKTVKYPKGIAENVLVGLGKKELFSKVLKPVSSLIKRVYMLSLRERMELDLEARMIGETLVINRSLDPFNRDYIELNDLNEPFELRKNQGDDLMPTIEEGEVIEEFRTRDDELDTGIDNYPSYCDHDKKIHIDYAYNLKFSCMIDFEVLEDMDAYHDEGIGDVIFGEPFLREVGINARRFKGTITIYNGNDEVTYQMGNHIRGLNATLIRNATRSHHY
ncbi:pyruvate dehydrogenase (acetyl-transferring) kinase, mitochondrial [Tanacetum coccineum]